LRRKRTVCTTSVHQNWQQFYTNQLYPWSDVIKRSLLDRDRHLRGLARGVYVIREIRVPIAEAVRGVSEPFEIAVGAPPQGLFGNWGLVLERLQLGDLVQQARKVAVFGAGNFGAVIQIGTRGSAGDQRCEQYDGQKGRDRNTRLPRARYRR
jgi:hypothetical protein